VELEGRGERKGEVGRYAVHILQYAILGRWEAGGLIK